MRPLNKTVGAIFIVAGTAIGGGMVAMPIASAAVGFEYSLYIMCAIWALMLFAALATLEISMHFKKGVSISYASEVFLGKGGKLLSSFTIGFLFYALLAAYMTGGASILRQILSFLFSFELNHTLVVLIFALIFGSIIAARTKAVDLSNRIFVFMMIGFFLLLIASLAPHLKISLLKNHPESLPGYLPLLIPLFFTSFGFHGSIPTIVNYVGPDPQKLRFIFTLGSIIPLIIYIIWEALSLGVLPLDGFIRIQNSGSDVGIFVDEISKIVSWTSFPLLIQGFTFLAIVTSFLGVGIGLFDFIQEHTQTTKKSLVSLATFGLPLLFALYYPNGFIIALSYAAIALSILAVIIPIMIVLKMRSMNLENTYHVSGGKFMLIAILIAGFSIIALDIFHML